MLGFLFGFNARLGRLHFFLATIALAVVTGAICFLIAMSEGVYAALVRTQPTFEPLTWPMLIAAGFFVVATFTLQSMRFRDIGWDPVCVIPAWIALLAVDKLVAGKIPAWSLGEGHNANDRRGAGQFRPDFGADVLAERPPRRFERDAPNARSAVGPAESSIRGRDSDRACGRRTIRPPGILDSR
jgi:hypothetical protein